MAAQVLVTGTLTVSGEGFPTTVIDFGRDGSLTIALTGGAQWTAANIAAGTANPTGNIESWQQQILKSSGASATDIIFTPKSWNGFKLDTDTLPHTYGFDGSGNLTTDTCTDGTNTWVKTYSYTSGVISSESVWVKQ